MSLTHLTYCQVWETGLVGWNTLSAWLLIYEIAKEVLEEGTVEAQGKPPQNMPQCHINYFELNLLKKEPMQELHFDPPLCLPERRK